MDAPDFKVLKKLADACRKAGIKQFKGHGMEFTLTDEAPVSNYKKAKVSKVDSTTGNDEPFESNSLPEEALLFWSANDPSREPSIDEQLDTQLGEA